MSEEQITNTNVSEQTREVVKSKSNRGRKPKYVDDNARKMAKREQNRTYRERKRNELIALRRLAAEVAKNNNSDTPLPHRLPFPARADCPPAVPEWHSRSKADAAATAPPSVGSAVP